MAQPIKRGSIYWLRKKVPDDLRPILDKTEEKFSLRTRDPAEAKIRFVKALSEIEGRWRSLRQGVRTLSHKESVAIAGEIYRQMVSEQEDNPDSGTHDLLVDRLAFGLVKPSSYGRDKEGSIKMLERLVEKGRARTAARIDAFLINEGYQLDSASRAALQKQCEQAIVKARIKTLAMANGDYSPDAAAAAFPAYASPRQTTVSPDPVALHETTLSTAIASWVKEKTRKDGDWKETTAAANELWARRFMELVGDRLLVSTQN